MGGTTSKTIAPEESFDITSELQKVSTLTTQQAQDIAVKAREQAETTAAAATAALGTSELGRGWAWFYAKVIAFLAVATGLFFLYGYLASLYGWPTLSFFDSIFLRTVDVPIADFIVIDSAVYSTPSGKVSVDVSDALQSMAPSNSTFPSFTVSYDKLGLTSDLVDNPISTLPNILNVKYRIGTSQLYPVSAVKSGEIFPQLPLPDDKRTPPTTRATPPSSSFFGSLFGGGTSGNLIGKLQDATQPLTIPSASAPLSNEKNGGYGIQWWMFINDWNYGYGKEKSVVKRSDSTSSMVNNPHISLHPTENTLKVSISIFPKDTSTSSKTEPAPAGHSSSTDDVFVCEVPNVPLQTWFAVSVTVFGRNLDIYIDGKLVKSCFLPGVPKPALGDLQLSPNGGFSGYMCDMNHMPRMLTPGDASNFFAAGTSCSSVTEPSVTSNLTGYSVKFGVYDTTGKEVQEYTF